MAPIAAAAINAIDVSSTGQRHRITPRVYRSIAVSFRELTDIPRLFSAGTTVALGTVWYLFAAMWRMAYMPLSLVELRSNCECEVSAARERAQRASLPFISESGDCSAGNTVACHLRHPPLLARPSTPDPVSHNVLRRRHILKLRCFRMRCAACSRCVGARN